MRGTRRPRPHGVRSSLHGESPPEVARYQAGVFTRAQAMAEGWSPGQIQRRLAAGCWQLVCGKALTAQRSPSARAFAWGARLTWPDAVVSHTTAAVIHGFPVPADAVAHVILHRHRSSIRGIRLHHLPLDAADVVRLEHGLALTGRRRTALDCLRFLSLDEGLDLYAWLSTREVLAPEDLVAALSGGGSRWGDGRIARILRLTEGGALSHGERLLHGILGQAGLAGWTANAPILVGGVVIARVDVLFEQQKIVIEVDGRRAHGSPEAFQRDRQRQNELQNAGYLVLRFTWEDLTRRPGEVLRQIVRALNARS